MPRFDFVHTQPPTLAPLGASFAENDVEKDLRDIAREVFAKTMADDTFDAMVSGAAHLGSFGLVRRTVNQDGLVLMPGSREEPSMRYLLRAWRAGIGQGRGLHFLRLYLQLLFPGAFTVHQMLQDKALPYPTALSYYDGNAIPAGKYLTSRIEVTIDLGASSQEIHEIAACAQAVVPARFVIYFRLITSGTAGTQSVVTFSATSVLNSSGVLL